jgi:hypothetical protein
MTEAEWLDCRVPDLMLSYLEGKVSERKLRLFACACCLRIGHLLTVPDCRSAVAVAVRFADGAASGEELAAMFRAARKARPLFADANWAATEVAAPSAIQAAADAALHSAQALARLAALPAESAAWAAVRTGATQEARVAAWARFEAVSESALIREQAYQADLLREIVGNPFQAVAAPSWWPSSVSELAEAIYQGDECAFALHDALLEAGHVELAEHFRQERHPRGCWAIDCILGKQ